MSLDSGQLSTLKADIEGNADGTVVAARNAGDAGAIANWYNGNASPDYHIYRKTVSATEIRNVIDAQDIADITDTDRSRAVDLLSLREDVGFSGEVARDRSAWSDIFSAAAGDNSEQAIIALWTRLATNAEVVFALSTGTGADAANADTTSWQGTLTFRDVANALNS